MAAGLHLEQFSECQHLAQSGDTARVSGGGSQVVDKTFVDQQIRIPGRGEDLANRQWDGGTESNLAEQRLILHRHTVLEPEQVIRLEGPTQLYRLRRGQPMVRIVQQDKLRTELVAGCLENARNVAQVRPGVPSLDLRRRAAYRGLVLLASFGRYAVRRRDTWDGRLHPDCAITVLAVLFDRLQQFRNVSPGCVGVDQTAGAASSPEQLIDRQAGRLPLDIP